MIQVKKNTNDFTAFVEDGPIVLRSWGTNEQVAEKGLVELIKTTSKQDISVVLQQWKYGSNSSGEALLSIPEGILELVHEALNAGETKIRCLEHLIK